MDRFCAALCAIYIKIFCFLGLNNSGTGSNMIMTNSSMSSTMAGMAGGGLVVSSSVNKTNATNMMAPGHPHHPTNHAVVQVSQEVVTVALVIAIAAFVVSKSDTRLRLQCYRHQCALSVQITDWFRILTY